MNEWAVFCMNGHFPLGQINPFKYFFGLATFFAVLFTLKEDNGGADFVFTLVNWLIQTNGMMVFFIGCHLLLGAINSSLVSWQKLGVSGFIATILFTPFSLIIDVFVETDTAFTVNNLAAEWLAMAPLAIICWFVINLPWIMGVNFNYSNKAEIYTDSADINGNPIKGNQLSNNDVIPVNSRKPFDKAISVPTFSHHNSEKEKAKENVNELSVTFPIDDFTRIIHKVGAENILFLKSELHYLSVGTEKAEQLILYSLKDAIHLLENKYKLQLGGQVHRSYWVNQQHIISLNKQGREGRLLLPNNYVVLVSRSHMPKVKGWF